MKEIDGTNLIVVRAQYGSKVAEHHANDNINQVNSLDTDLVEVGDEFGFSESRSFFDNDGQEYSTSLGRDVG